MIWKSTSLFNIAEFTHLNSLELPYCLMTKLLKWDFGKLFCHAMLQFMLKSVWMAYVASDEELHRKPLPIIFIEIAWGEWPSGLRIKRLLVWTALGAQPRDPTSLWGSQWPSSWSWSWVTSGEWGCPLDNGPKLAMGQPNNSYINHASHLKLFFSMTTNSNRINQSFAMKEKQLFLWADYSFGLCKASWKYSVSCRNEKIL